jgi:hypothetical protein
MPGTGARSWPCAQISVDFSSRAQYDQDIVSIHALDNLVAAIAQIICDEDSHQIRLNHKYCS